MAYALHIFADPAALFRYAADEFVRVARRAIAERGRFTVALSGGSTSRGLFALLARELETVAWDRVEVCWSNERHLPRDHPDSHYRLAHDHLLRHVPVSDAQVHRIPASGGDASRAAAAYERTLRGLLPPTGRFDLVLLGLGPQGHTASLFPGSPALDERARWVRAAPGPDPGGERITLTPPALNAAGEVAFLVSGPEKARALRAVLEGDHDPARWPAQAVRPASGRLLWLADEPAASQLTPRSVPPRGA